MTEPRGLDSFDEGLSSFEQQASQPPTAAVESASQEVAPSTIVHATIVEPQQMNMANAKDKPPEEPEDAMMTKLKTFYEENQTMVLGAIVAGAVGYYFYSKREKQ